MGLFDSLNPFAQKKDPLTMPRLALGIERIPVPRSIEPRGWLILGEQGSGKTTMILSLCEQLRGENDMMIFYDTKPDFFSRYFNSPNSVTFGLGVDKDVNAYAFQIFKEIASEKDVDFIVNCLVVSEGDGSNANSAHFLEQAKLLMKATLLSVWQNNKKPSNIELIDFLLENDTPDKFVKQIEELGIAKSYGLSVSSVLAGGKATDPQAASAWANFQKYATKLKRREFYTNEGIGASQAIEYYEKERKRINIFILNPANDQDSFSAWARIILGCFSRAVRSLPNNNQNGTNQRRIWFIADEFQTLGRFPEIAEELPAQGRSKGACVVLASQNLAKLKHVYGESLTNAIVSGGGTKIIFRMSDPYSLSLVEKVFGDQEIEETSYSNASFQNGASKSTSTSSKIRTQKVIMGSEISSLPDRVAYLKIANHVIDVEFSVMSIMERFKFNPKEPPRFREAIKPEPNKFADNSVAERESQKIGEKSEDNESQASTKQDSLKAPQNPLSKLANNGK